MKAFLLRSVPLYLVPACSLVALLLGLVVGIATRGKPPQTDMEKAEQAGEDFYKAFNRGIEKANAPQIEAALKRAKKAERDEEQKMKALMQEAKGNTK